jgi:uncharacterized membrane protein YedE/YeeE
MSGDMVGDSGFFVAGAIVAGFLVGFGIFVVKICSQP